MKKRNFVVFVLVLAVMFCATACKPNILEKPDDEYSVNLTVDKNITETLTLMIPSNDGDVERNYITSLIPGFKELYPNVTIKFDARPISDDKYAESVSAAIASQNVPDLFWTNTLFYYYLIAKNCVVSLEPYYRAEKEADTLDLEGEYYEAFFNMSTYQDKRYIVPRSMDSVVTYFNTEILEAAGIDYKTDQRMSNSWTWADLESLCKQVSDFILSEEGKTLGYSSYYALQPEFSWEAVFNPVMLSYGSQVFADNGDVTIDSPETVEMANMIRGLKEEGRVLRDSTSGSTFTNGKVAFTFSSSGPSNMALHAQISDKFDALPFPLIGDNPKIGCGFVGYGISSTTEGVKRDLAWQFLRYMISKKGQMELINGGLATPSIRVDLAEEKEWSKGFSHLNLDAWLVGEKYKVCSNFYTKHDPACSFDILRAIQNLMNNLTDSTKSVERCVEECKSDLQEAISQ